MPKNDEVGDKIWVTNESDTLNIYEYSNKAKYRNNTPKIHKLKPPGFRVSSRKKNCVRFDNSLSSTTAEVGGSLEFYTANEQ